MSVDIKKFGNENLDEALNAGTIIKYQNPMNKRINGMITVRKNKRTEIGKKYNKLTVVGPEFSIRAHFYVVCECECGKYCCYTTGQITKGNAKSCSKLCSLGIKPDSYIGKISESGYLTTISDPYRWMTHWLVNARCKCGWEGRLFLLNNPQFHQGCSLYMEDHFYDTGISDRFFNQIIKRAKKKNLEFNLTKEYLGNLFIQQKGRCSATCWKIKIPRRYHSNETNTASLDRIDSTKGYVIGNVQWVHKFINWSKRNFSMQDYIDLCYLVFTYPCRIFDILNIQIFPRRKCYKGFGNISQQEFARIKNNAKIRIKKNMQYGIQVNVDGNYLWKLFLEQNGRCNKTGMPIYSECSSLEKPKFGRRKDRTASVDRIDSNGHYDDKNVQWVHYMINLMKYKFSEELFMEICTAVALNHWSSENADKLLEPIVFKFENLLRKGVSKTGPAKGRKYKGVKLTKYNSYSVYCTITPARVNVGTFKSEEEAAKNYDYHARNIYGEGCYLNFPDFDYTNFIPKVIIDYKNMNQENKSLTYRDPNNVAKTPN